ncbi:hypothetical protein GGF39_002364 [Coemansia sp. RSA 1721]|nr:hypothetical protein GGF39_002364 [Coemansia sp. RSA 1721]
MEVRLDAFSASDFNVKDWLNEQFATLDAEAAFGVTAAESSDGNSNDSKEDSRHARQQEQDTLVQKLTTQLHLLATNAQQNSDRIKARFRHQTPQIVRDLAALAKLVKETQASVASFAEKIDARSMSAPAVDSIVDMDTVRNQLDRSISALRHLRNYTDLPQKIAALVDSGDLDQAWNLIDSAVISQTDGADGPAHASAGAGGSVGLSQQEAQGFRTQIETAALARLEEVISAHDAQRTLETARLLKCHGRGDAIESIYVRLRSEIGAKQLQPAVDKCKENNLLADNLDAVLNLVTELVSRERMFIEAAELPGDAAALLEALLANYLELLQPVIQRKIDAIRSNPSVDGAEGSRPSLRITDLYHYLVSFYVELSDAISSSPLSVGDSSLHPSAGSMLSRPVPRSLNLLFVPFVSFMGVLGSTEADFIRSGSLSQLKRLEPDYAHIESYVRDASAALLAIFVDVEQALERVFSLVPVSKLRGAVSEIVSVVANVSKHLASLVGDIAKKAGIPAVALDDFSDLTLPATLASSRGHGSSEDPIYQPMTSSEKLDVVSSMVAVSILSRIFDQYASALSLSVEKQWAALLDSLRRQQAQLPAAEDFSGSTADISANSSTEPDFTINPAKLLLSVFMESCATVSEMQSVVIMPLLAPDAVAVVDTAVAAISSSGLRLSRETASAVFFLLTSAFRVPLARIPRLAVWHADAQSKSSMNIDVPVFSSSPSEEAVDIGEKLHILLPELEQVEVMDVQYTQGVDLEGAVPALHYYAVACLDGASSIGKIGEPADAESLSIQPMLSLVLRVVSQNIAKQVCAIEPKPLSESGKQQLAADIDYIASVVQSFTNAASPEFSLIRRYTWPYTGQNDGLSASNAESPADLEQADDTGIGSAAGNKRLALVKSGIEGLLGQP